jgi:hypothetical protein
MRGGPTIWEYDGAGPFMVESCANAEAAAPAAATSVKPKINARDFTDMTAPT